MKKIPTEWNLSELGKSYKDIRFLHERTLLEKKSKTFSNKWKRDKGFLKDEKTLKKALDQYSDLQYLGTKEPIFLWLSLQIDSSNIQLQASMKKFEDFSNTIADHVRFFLIELGTIDIKQQKIFLSSHLLKDYKSFLKGIFETARFTLSEKEERIISFKSGVAHDNWESMLSEFLSREKREVIIQKIVHGKNKLVKEEKTLSDIATLVASPIKKVRDSARLALIDILKKYAPVAEKEINSILENKKIDDQLRGYERPDSSRHIGEDISTQIVDTLRKVVQDNYKISHQFHVLKSQLLGQSTFTYEERALGYGKLTKTYSYEDSVNLVEKAFTHIDQSFVDVFNDFVKKGKIDVYPKTGKRGGAFCMSHGVKDPVYIMLNHTDDLRDVTTLAHEVGHGIHATFAKRESQLNYAHPMCTAEVASTFCEDFVFDELIRQASDEERLIIMMAKLQDKVQTIFRQIAAYNFEFELHNEFRKQGYLSLENIGKIFNYHMKSYLGSRFVFDDDSSLGWVSWGHFRSPFYVYSYAMGLLCAQAMQAELRKNPEFISSIKEFYSTGSSLSPVDIFKKMGMDITQPEFWQKGIDEIKDLLQETKKLAKKLGKIEKL